MKWYWEWLKWEKITMKEFMSWFVLYFNKHWHQRSSFIIVVKIHYPMLPESTLFWPFYCCLHTCKIESIWYKWYDLHFLYTSTQFAHFQAVCTPSQHFHMNCTLVSALFACFHTICTFLHCLHISTLFGKNHTFSSFCLNLHFFRDPVQ